MPTPKQMERLAATPRRPPEAPYPGTRPADDLPEAYWEFIVQDHRGQIRTGVPIQQRRLSEIPRHVLRVTCRRCDRIVEIQTVDAVRVYGLERCRYEAARRWLPRTDRRPRGGRLLAVI
jgi:hypothetical protein